MSTRNLLLPLATTDGPNGWKNLTTRINVEQASNSADNLPPICASLTIISPETNADGTYVEITSDPVTFTPAYRLLKEESKEFVAQIYNNLSTMDKWIRIVDSLGAATNGDARVVLEFA